MRRKSVTIKLDSFAAGAYAVDKADSGLRRTYNLWAPAGKRLSTRPGTQIVAAGPVDYLPASAVAVAIGTSVVGPLAGTNRIVTLTGSDWVYVGCETAFDGFHTGPVGYNKSSLSYNYELEVQYWNGDAWTALDVLDGTRAYMFDGVAVNPWLVPLEHEGQVHFTRPPDWATTQFAAHTGAVFYYVRFRTRRVSTTTAEFCYASWTNQSPGFRVFQRNPMNGLRSVRTRNTDKVFVGADTRAGAYVGGAVVGVINESRTADLLHPAWYVGTGYFGEQDTPNGGAFGTSPGTTGIGAPNTLTDTSSQNDLPDNGFEGRSPWTTPIYQNIAVNFDFRLASMELTQITTFDAFLQNFATGDLEGFMLEVTTAGGFASVGQRFEIAKFTRQGGSTEIQFAQVTTAMGNPGALTRFMLLPPPSVFAFNVDKEYTSVGGPPIGVTEFEGNTFPWARSLTTKPVGLFKLCHTAKQVMPRGRTYSVAIDPTDGTLLFTNGGIIWRWDGILLRKLEVFPFDSPIMLKIAAVIPRDAQGTADDASQNLAGLIFLPQPPRADLMRIFAGRIVTSRGNALRWSMPAPLHGAWQRSAEVTLNDEAGGDITSIAVRDRVLVVSTRQAMFEGGFDDSGFFSYRRANVEGFVSHAGTIPVNFDEISGVMGPTERGLSIYTSGEPTTILPRWDYVVPSGIDTEDLVNAPAVFVPAWNSYLIAVRSISQPKRSTIVVYDATNKALWRWEMPFGITSFDYAPNAGQADQVLIGCDDGFIRTFIRNAADDGVDVAYGMRTSTQRLVERESHRMHVHTLSLTIKSDLPPTNTSVTLYRDDDDEPWMSSFGQWYDNDPSYADNAGYHATRYSSNMLVTTNINIPSGFVGRAVSLEFSGTGYFELERILFDGVAS
jgi:hypothetical protein